MFRLGNRGKVPLNILGRVENGKCLRCHGQSQSTREVKNNRKSNRLRATRQILENGGSDIDRDHHNRDRGGARQQEMLTRKELQARFREGQQDRSGDMGGLESGGERNDGQARRARGGGVGAGMRSSPADFIMEDPGASKNDGLRGSLTRSSLAGSVFSDSSSYRKKNDLRGEPEDGGGSFQGLSGRNSSPYRNDNDRHRQSKPDIGDSSRVPSRRGYVDNHRRHHSLNSHDVRIDNGGRLPGPQHSSIDTGSAALWSTGRGGSSPPRQTEHNSHCRARSDASRFSSGSALSLLGSSLTSIANTGSMDEVDFEEQLQLAMRLSVDSASVATSRHSSTSSGKGGRPSDEAVHPSILRLISQSDPSLDAESFLRTMGINPNSEELQAVGCKRIAEWAAEPDSAPSEMVLKALVSKSRKHGSSPEVQRHILDALGGFCSSSYGATLRGKIILIGGLEVVKDALRNHLTTASVNEAGCAALGWMFNENDRTIDALRNDDVDAVAMAMQVRRKKTGN